MLRSATRFEICPDNPAKLAHFYHESLRLHEAKRFLGGALCAGWKRFYPWRQLPHSNSKPQTATVRRKAWPAKQDTNYILFGPETGGTNQAGSGRSDTDLLSSVSPPQSEVGCAVPAATGGLIAADKHLTGAIPYDTLGVS
jgi:hypothetical protein